MGDFLGSFSGCARARRNCGEKLVLIYRTSLQSPWVITGGPIGRVSHSFSLCHQTAVTAPRKKALVKVKIKIVMPLLFVTPFWSKTLNFQLKISTIPHPHYRSSHLGLFGFNPAVPMYRTRIRHRHPYWLQQTSVRQQTWRVWVAYFLGLWVESVV